MTVENCWESYLMMIFLSEILIKPWKVLTWIFRKCMFHQINIYLILSISLAKQDISLIPVVGDGTYIGSIRKQDIISFLGNGFSFSFPGSIIELGVLKRNYSLAEISQIVESENAKILSVFIPETTSEESKLKVILKINKNDISKIIAGFERYEYEINASYTENNDLDDFLKDRYDSLMRYLNI